MNNEELPLWDGGEVQGDRLFVLTGQVREALKERMGVMVFDRWLSRLEIESVDDTKVVVGVPSIMHQCWVEDSCLPVLSDVLAGLLGGQYDIEIEPTIAEITESEPVTYLEAARAPAPVAQQQEVVMGPLFAGDHRLTKSFASSGLNHRYSFDAFVVGPNCSYSYAVAKAVADQPGKVYNPLFMYGSSGLGKTHLMQAIGQEILRTKSRKVVRYVTCEAFTNEYIEALRHGGVTAFREKYRKVDVLLIDDIQFLAGKGGIQEEFFHTFNDLFNSFKQIVMTSDRAPSHFKNVENRLVSRFEWGMATQIESPDLETRTAILKHKISNWTVPIEDWVLKFLAENIRTNIRRLEGALMRVAAYVSIDHANPLTEQVLRSMLEDIMDQADGRILSIDWIQKAVAEHFDIRLADMTSKRRHAAIAVPRQVAMFLARELTRSTLKEIGEAFGGKDHGTVIHACKTITIRMEDSEEFRRLVNQLTDKIKNS